MSLQPTAAARRAALSRKMAQDRANDGSDPCAGTAFLSPAGRVLFVRRSDTSDHGGEWALPGGHRDPGETAEDAARREAQEELGTCPKGKGSLLHSGDGYTTFLHNVGAEFKPTLNEEHTEYAWAEPTKAPQPLHPGVTAIMPKLALPGATRPAMDCLAFDRSASVRTIDQDGRLQVSVTHISKANVCEYLGAEIPGSEDMGLDPKRLYKLLRDPEELEKAASSFNNIPLLSEHVPFAANDHDKNIIVGSTGSTAAFRAPYLDNSLVVWDAEAIEGIESEEKRELSCAYRYVPDMTPGTYEGVRYDGVMRDIRGNHVAIVAAGRAGSDVIVGDSQLKESLVMSTKTLSRKATLVKGALLAFLCPRLATDSSIDLNAVLKGVDAKNWGTSKPKIVTAIEAAVSSKKLVLASDASIDGLVDLLDGLDKQETAMDPAAAATGLPGEAEEGDVMDADPVDTLLAALKGKMPDEELAALGAKLKACLGAGMDADTDPAKVDLKKDPDPDPAGNVAASTIDKKAMDTAIDAAVKKSAEGHKVAMDAAVKKAKDDMRAIAAAEAEVFPLVGKLDLAFDSANSVYKAALETIGVDVKDIHESAYRSILSAQTRSPEAVRFGMDGKQAEGFKERFPEASRIAHA